MTAPDDPAVLGGGDVEPDSGEYDWMPPEADPDRASRWRESDEAVRTEDEGSDDGDLQ